MGETWLVIEGFPDYEVSNLGRVRSFKRPVPIILKPWNHPFGYGCVTLAVRGQKQQKRIIHILVCHAFHGPKPSPRHEVAHADGNPKNSAADNLRWATSAENHADSCRHGTHFYDGQFKPTLTADSVREIRILLAGGTPRAIIAKRFSTAISNISAIKIGRSWKHLDMISK